MYSVAVGWNVLYMSVRLIWPIVLLKCFLSILIFCLNILSIFESEVLKSSTMIVLLSQGPLGIQCMPAPRQHPIHVRHTSPSGSPPKNQNVGYTFYSSSSLLRGKFQVVLLLIALSHVSPSKLPSAFHFQWFPGIQAMSVPLVLWGRWDRYHFLGKLSEKPECWSHAPLFTFFLELWAGAFSSGIELYQLGGGLMWVKLTCSYLFQRGCSQLFAHLGFCNFLTRFWKSYTSALVHILLLNWYFCGGK